MHTNGLMVGMRRWHDQIDDVDFKTSGALQVFSPDFNPADVVTETWGTITFPFDDCRSGTVHLYATSGFGSGVYEIARLQGTERYY